MLTVLTGIFFCLHGLVHLLYAGQSGRLFELRPGMVWPDRSWIFSKLLGDETTRWVVTVLLVIVAIAFLTGGVGLFIRQPWWRAVLIGAGAFSSLIFLLFWDGKFQELPDKGGVGILINLAVIVLVYLFRWPV